MKIILTFFCILFISTTESFSQFLIPGEGLMDIKIGIDWDEVEWELGFKGNKIEKGSVSPQLKFIAEKAEIDFDFVVSYRHIMWLPVSDLFFKDNLVCMIQLSSYPEYNKMLCADIGTVEGLNFWDDKEKIDELYGEQQIYPFDQKSYIAIIDKGIGVEMLDNEVRTMIIFPPQMK